MLAIIDRRLSMFLLEPRVTAALDPPVQAAGEHPREQVRNGEQPPLAAIEYVDILDRVVHLAVLELGQAISVIAFK